ncbi:MAG: excinuclease ABC subunit C [Rhizobiales bacterium NRL2]|jgi:putative endonuclease|nr:MAG: excinuclease ABC subunit C [Rhizobiales bacterium NRL2]
MAGYFIYILASRRNGTLYIGLTNDLRRRLAQHREGWSEFTRKYRVHHLVYFENHSDIQAARQRERTLKYWRRNWKLALIEKLNPDWRDLEGEIPFD